MRNVIQLVAALALTILGVAVVAAENQVARGEYLGPVVN
jgi:hypothetical protein